ncbi:AP2-like factor ANT lineage protein [Dioscorea alata]|uniref:AP2-like factor ANT lineage protein n=1 Tax=Dioscorea alata TaxID=55571 RepID=A0ACB7WJN4_DIOAL|nr:AP2-like factor ANT lineage protein [Dioscorea alata]
MDMDNSHNWLAFSLSHQPCLLEAFSSSPHGEEGGGGEMEMVGGREGPKLEDFLGAFPTEGGHYDASDLKSIAAGLLRPDTSTVSTTDALVPAPADARRPVDTFGQRTSIYRGVTRHRWTGRYEAHLWDNSCRREGQSRKGRQVYLGGYDKEDKAARAYDLAALKYWGPTTTTNFPVSNYEKELEEMKNMTRQEFVASLRRKSSGFSRGASIYRGVTRHHQHGRWQARIGRVAGNKDLYLGTFSTQEEAAEAYDIAAIKFRGLNAVTNFDMSRYDIKSIINSNLPIGGMTGKGSKTSESSSSSSDALSIDVKQSVECHDASSSIGFAALPVKSSDQDYWSFLAFQQQQQQQQQQNSSNAALGFGVFSNGVNMGFMSSHDQQNNMMGHGSGCYVWNNNGMVGEQQEQSSSCNSMPYGSTATTSSSYYEGNNNYVGNWGAVAPNSSTAYYQYETGKTNMGLVQTPIYGIE